MKKTILALVLFFGVVAGATAQNDPQRMRAENVATAAARSQCLNQGNYPNGLETFAYAEVNLFCDYFFNSNPNITGYTVTVYAYEKCPPQTLCKPYIFTAATVMVDCNGNVYDVQCGSTAP